MSQSPKGRQRVWLSSAFLVLSGPLVYYWKVLAYIGKGKILVMQSTSLTLISSRIPSTIMAML